MPHQCKNKRSMKPLHTLLISLLTGSLLTGASLGTWSYVHIQTLKKENGRLQQQLRKATQREENLSDSQGRLQTELEQLKTHKVQEYDHTIEALMQAKANANIDALYAMGIKALQEKDYPRAYFALNQVNQNNPKYKELATHYPVVQKAYSQYQQQLSTERLKDTYAQAYDHQAKGQWAQAKVNYQRVIDIQANYKDAKARLESVSKTLYTYTHQQALEQHKKWLESTYQLGLSEQSLGRYAQAKEAYEHIVKDAPKYKDSSQRLKTVSALVPKPQASAPIQSINCYEKGVTFGKCSSLGAETQSCNPEEMSNLQTSCKGNPEFAKGVKSATSTNSGAWLKGLDTLKNL